MAKPEWGTKRLCPNCGTRYYDMRHDPIVCPHCGAAFDPEALLKTRRTRAAPAVAQPAAEEELEPDLSGDEAATEETEADVPNESEEDEETEGEEEEEEEVLEDASELGEDEDDMAEVIENVDDEDE